MNYKIKALGRILLLLSLFVLTVLVLSFIISLFTESTSADELEPSYTHSSLTQKESSDMSDNNPKNSPSDKRTLSAAQRSVLFDKATEPPFSGKYNDFDDDGIYLCAACSAPLFRSSDKFKSSCGWPSFDDEFPNAIKRVPDGNRTEIVCSRCNSHLGHVFTGEQLTDKNLRHCVNSLSLDFIPAKYIGKAIVAGGCFWGVEELIRRKNGVISAISGYVGGKTENPDYKSVCSGTTGHLEAVEVLFDKRLISYSDVIREFFEIHDFTQKNGQGPDIGEQYKSAIFCLDDEQIKDAQNIIKGLKSRGYDVATRIERASKFYPAEDYHQRYYERKGGEPYCHIKRKLF